MSFLLACGLSGSMAYASAMETPLTTASLNAWLKKVCATASCREVPARTLVPTHVTQVFPESRAYVITKAGHKFYLLHDFAPISGRLPLQELTLMPYRLSDKWTLERLNIVAGWLTGLAGGQLKADHMWKCVMRIKQQNAYGMPFDALGDGALLKFLRLNSTETATGSCYWLKEKRNVGFGFAGKGKY